MAIGVGVQVVAHAPAEVEQRLAGQRMARGEVGEQPKPRPSSPAPRRTTPRPPRSARRPRVAGVDEVVERAEDEVEQVHVVAELARQQPAGERERPRDALGRRARLRQPVAVSSVQQHAAASSRGDRGR